VRALLALLLAVALVAGCSSDAVPDVYGAPTAPLGTPLDVAGWNLTATNLRFDGDYVLVDVDGSARGGDQAATAESIRFGLYGALAHPIESNAVGGCANSTSLGLRPASSPAPDKLSGTVCLGPLRDQSQVRGVYAYSPRDRMPGTTVAYAAAFPVGLLPTNDTDTGLVVTSTSVDAFDATGAQLAPTALGEPTAFEGNGYMLLGLEITGLAAKYRDDSHARGGPLMVVVAPTLPAPGLSHACDTYGASLLVLPYADLQAVALRASLCTQGEINRALLFPSVSVIGTHAALWTRTS
jgi:hypothetical protein